MGWDIGTRCPLRGVDCMCDSWEVVDLGRCPHPLTSEERRQQKREWLAPQAFTDPDAAEVLADLYETTGHAEDARLARGWAQSLRGERVWGNVTPAGTRSVDVCGARLLDDLTGRAKVVVVIDGAPFQTWGRMEPVVGTGRSVYRLTFGHPIPRGPTREAPSLGCYFLHHLPPDLRRRQWAQWGWGTTGWDLATTQREDRP